MKKILFILFLILSPPFVVKSLEIKSDTGIDFNPKIGHADTWTFNTSYDSNIKVLLINRYGSDYLDRNIRVKIINDPKTGDGLINSSHYGSFFPSTILELIKDNSLSAFCTDGDEISYSFSGVLNSPYFGDLNISSSTYCPKTKKMTLSLNSSLLGSIKINNFTTDNSVISSVLNFRNEAKDVETSKIFDNRKLDISGKIKVKETSTNMSEYKNSNDYQINRSEVSGSLSLLKKTISKNIIKYTSGLSTITTNTNLTQTIIDQNNLIYYDLSGQVTGDNGDGNKGKIIKLGNGGLTSSYSKIGISGEKILIIKGANLYIDTDIYNLDKNSIFTIIIQRDKNNNGGNIYINPNVTNIDAVIHADGSILNYNGTFYLTRENNTVILRKQLLIYGSISSRNTIGVNKAPYGSDLYIRDGKDVITTKYNLEYLRTFQPILNDDIVGICSGINQIVAMGNTEDSAIEYAFAGKKQCNIKDIASANLKTTDKLSPVVIEYNPMINILNPKILRED